MRRAILRPLIAGISAGAALFAATHAGAGVPADGDVAIDPASILATAVDVTLTDKAVTDAELASTGVTANTLPGLLSSPDVLVVDDDLVQCPEAEFTTINAAVAAAPPNGRIKVCPGLYKESVPVLKPGLWLQAPRHQGQATECKTDVTPDPSQHAILAYNAALNGGNPSVGFDVHASGVTIEGFTIQPDPAFVSGNGVGIFTDRAFGGYDIRHNVVQRNTIGVYFNSAGASSVRENCIRNNTLGGSASGTGVYSDQGLAESSIANNSFTRNRNAVIIDTFLTTPRDVEIVHNESIDDGAIVVFNSEDVTVDYNRVERSAGSGIFLFNVLGGSASSNHLQGGAFTGISLNANTGDFLVKSNKVSGFTTGIRLGAGASGNAVETNRVTDNRSVGLRAADQSSANTIRENHMRGNPLDCSDLTAGTGTSGTANFWINDLGYTEDRMGICKRAAFVGP